MFKAFSAFLARILISTLFILIGIINILNWAEAEQMLTTALTVWQTHLSSFQDLFSFLISWGPVLLAISTFFNLLGGLMILFGLRERFGALLLILILVPSTLCFHAFWFLEDGAYDWNKMIFLKNLAVLAGLIIVAMNGARVRKKEERLS